MADDSTPTAWFGARLDWVAKTVTVAAAMLTGAWMIFGQIQSANTQLLETRSAITQLGQKLDDSMGKQADRVSGIERDWRGALDSARTAGARERQILENRVIQLEAKQEADDKRAREDAVIMATLREQLSNLIMAVNKLSDLVGGPMTPLRIAPKR